MNTTLRRGFAGALTSALLTVGFGVTGTANAEEAGNEVTVCAEEQAHVDKAVAKLAALQEVYAKAKQQLRKADKALQKAETKVAKQQARAAIAKARVKLDNVTKVQKGQVQRVAKAEERLVNCLAAAPTEEPTDEV